VFLVTIWTMTKLLPRNNRPWTKNELNARSQGRSVNSRLRNTQLPWPHRRLGPGLGLQRRLQRLRVLTSRGRNGRGSGPKRSKRRAQLNRFPTSDFQVLRRCSREPDWRPCVLVPRGLCSRLQGHFPRGERPGPEKTGGTERSSCSSPRLAIGCGNQEVGHIAIGSCSCSCIGAPALRDYQLR
jgi:hypothetical protein